MSYEVDYGVFIGRFQPLHMGHQHVIDTALEKCEKLIILVGSAFEPRTIRNPWTWEERAANIRNLYGLTDRIIIRPLRDYTYRDNEWLKAVQTTVNDIIDGADPRWSDKPAHATKTIALIGSAKDKTGFYLNLFPQWASIPVFHKFPLNATDIRKSLFSVEGPYTPEVIQEWMNPHVYAQIDDDMSQPWAFDLRDELAWINRFRKPYEDFKKLNDFPWDVQFITTDACVVQSGHVLLIQRNARPGIGLWALPGGYLESDEKIEDSIFRELNEETKPDIFRNTLRAAWRGTRSFDEPHRSPRGRIVTHVGLYVLPDGPLPKVKGNKVEGRARWTPISDLRSDNMFEDHFHISQTLLASV